MSYPQVFYTSCVRGLRGGSGFQINAASPDLDPAVLQHVERLGAYVPPLSAPTQPSAEQLEQFPVTLLFERLPDGRAVIAQARYVGQDYSGRFGNFFTHSVIVADPERELSDPLPIELWRSDLWKTSAIPTTTIEPLSRLQAGGEISPDRIPQLLHDDDRIRHFAALLTAVEQALATGRRIVLVAGEDTALWIAAVCYALPRALALRLTFTTYTKSPYDSTALLVGTTPDSDFGFAPHEIEHQYFVFDFVGQRFTTIAVHSAFSQQIAALYRAQRVEEVARFSRVIGDSYPDLAVSELAAALSCFALGHGWPVPATDITAAVRWSAARVAGLDPALLTNIFDRVMAIHSSTHVASLGAALYHAVAELPAAAPARAAIEGRFLAWLIATPCPDAAIAGLTLPATTIAAARTLRGRWLDRIRQGASGDPLCSALRLGHLLGFLSEGGELRELGQLVGGAVLADRGVQALVTSLAETPGGSELVRGVGLHLAARLEHRDAVADAAPLLAQPVVAGLIEDLAARHDLLALYILVSQVRVAQMPDHRPASFRAIVGRFGLSDKPEVIAAVFQALWAELAPSIEDALVVLEVVPGEALARTSIPARLGDALTTDLDFLNPSANQRALAARLSCLDIRAALGVDAAILDALRVACEPRFGSTPAALDDAIATCRELPPRLAGRFLLAMASRTATLDDHKQHTRVFAHMAGRVPAFETAYADACEVHLASLRHPEPHMVAGLFHIWWKLEGLGHGQLVQRLLDHALSAAASSWSRGDLNRIEQALERWPPAVERWRRWRTAHAPSLLTRINRLLGRGRYSG